MTFDEFWVGFSQHGRNVHALFKGHNYQTGKAIWEAATKAEREACAALCDGIHMSGPNGAGIAADRIRMRSNACGEPGLTEPGKD